MADMNTPAVGGVTDKQTDSIFNTKDNEPVRDKTADFSKGKPITRFFTEDGTPVEPATVQPAGTPWNLQAPDASTRDDVIAAVEYVDEDGSTVTHESLKAKQEADKKAQKNQAQNKRSK